MSIIGKSRLKFFSLIVTGALLLNWAQIWAAENGSAHKELILIINVDTLRYDKLGIYGNNRKLTPFIDNLAKKYGVIFNQCYSSSNTTRPSVVSLFTGTYPTKHGFWNFRSEVKISKPNIATVLPNDYVSILVNANPNTFFIFSNDFDYSWSEYPDKYPKYADCAYFPAEYIFNKALFFLKESNFPNKVLMYLQPADPHSPYFPLKKYPDLFEGDIYKDKYSGKYRSELDGLYWDENLSKRTNSEVRNLKNRYDAEVRYLDEQLNQFWQSLKKEYKKILFIFTSDHGESFLDHNDAGHESSLYNEQIKIPFIIIDTEKRFGKPRTTDILVSNIDMLPTIAEVVGYQKELKVDGESIFKLLRYFKKIFPINKNRVVVSEFLYSNDVIDVNCIEDAKIKEVLNFYINNPLKVLIRAHIKYSNSILRHSIYKYIRNENPIKTKILLRFPKLFFQPQYSELYRIESDFNEKNNIVSTRSSLAWNIVEMSPLKRLYPEFYTTDIKLRKEEIEKLKSLGYIR